MELFQIKNNRVTFAPQTLLLEPYKKLWSRDKTKDKTLATAELAYVWFYCDLKSPFSIILDSKDRIIEIKKVVLELHGAWEPDTIVEEACEYYKENKKTVSSEILDNTISLMLRINAFIKDINPADTYVDKFGNIKFKYDFLKIVNAAKQIPSILATLNEVREQVLKEQEVDAGMRGSRQKSIFESGI